MTSWGGALGNIAQGIGGSALAGQLMKALGPAVLSTAIEQLNQNGMGAKVNSWLGRGENQPITPDEIRQGLNNATLQQMAQQLGIPVGQIADVLAQHLPATVDHASQGGVLDGRPG
jgi:uncharacterized protein YidB (DUF937 family)